MSLLQLNELQEFTTPHKVLLRAQEIEIVVAWCFGHRYDGGS